MISVLVYSNDDEVMDILEEEGFEVGRIVRYEPPPGTFIIDHSPSLLDEVIRFILNRPWTVMIATSLITFLNSFMSKAGEDAYVELRRVFTRVLSIRRRNRLDRRRSRLIIRDDDCRIFLELPEKLSDDAFQSLFSSASLEKLSSLAAQRQRRLLPRSTLLVWNEEVGEWVAKGTYTPPGWQWRRKRKWIRLVRSAYTAIKRMGKR
jgi:hypothetical protein